MKKIIISTLFMLFGSLVNAQYYQKVQEAKDYIDSVIINNNSRSITPLKLNTALNKIIQALNLLDTAGAASNVTDITYAALQDSISANALKPGSNYRITDFVTRYKIFGTATDTVGSSEPLIVSAISYDQISNIAYSPAYPQDIIYYSLNDATELAPTSGSKGVITYRKSTDTNLSAYYDWRNIRWRRWAIHPAPGLYYAYDIFGGINSYQSLLSFAGSNHDITLESSVFNVVIGTGSYSIHIGKHVGALGSGVTITNDCHDITIGEGSALVNTVGSGYFGGIFIDSESQYVNIGKRSYNIAIGYSAYAIDLGLQQSDVFIEPEMNRRRLEKGFSNFEATATISGKQLSAYSTIKSAIPGLIYNTAQYCGIFNVTSGAAIDTLDILTALTTSLTFHPIEIRPASGQKILIRDKTLGITGANIDMAGNNLLIDGAKNQFAIFKKNMSNSLSTQPTDFYLLSTNVINTSSNVVGDSLLTDATMKNDSISPNTRLLGVDTSKISTKRYTDSLFASVDAGSVGLSAVTANDSTTDTGIKIATQASVGAKGYMTFFGNSVTAGYGLPNLFLRWSKRVANFLGYTENNAGLSSSTLMKRTTIDPFGAANMVDRISLIPYYDPGNFDKLVFSYGTNDVRWNGANYTTANFVADYTTILDSCIARGWTGSNIILTGTFYVSPTSYVSYGGNPVPTKERQLSFDSCISVLATTYGAKYIDFYNFMAANGGNSLSQSDSIHPNTHGHKVMAMAFINQYNEPVRLNGQKLAVNGTAEFSNIRVTTFPTTSNEDIYEVVVDSLGRLAASTVQHVVYNPHGNLKIGFNAVDTPYKLAVDGSAYIGEGVNIVNVNGSSISKWLRLFSDYTTGASLIDAYSPTGAKAQLSLNSNSKGNVKIAYADPSYNSGHIFDSIYANLGSTVIHSYPPAFKTGLNLTYLAGTASIISSNTTPSTYTTPLSIQPFGEGKTIIGGYTGADSILRVIGGIHGTGGVRFSGLPSNQTYSKSLAVTSNGTLYLKDTLTVSGVYAPLASPTFTGTATIPTVSLSTTVSGAGTWTAGAISTSSNVSGNLGLFSGGVRAGNNTNIYWNSGPVILGNTNDVTIKNAAATAGANVSIGTSAAAASAILDVTSTAKGVLLPRMTSTQRDAISSPATGLTLFCTDCTATDASTGVMQTYNGSAWKNNW